MTIEPNRLVVRTVKHDGIAGAVAPAPTCLRIVPVSPPNAYGAPSGGQLQQPPGYEGELRAVDSGTDGVCRLYVVVEISGALTWKLVKPSSGTTDSRTGRPYDANAGFYSPLAT